MIVCALFIVFTDESWAKPGLFMAKACTDLLTSQSVRLDKHFYKI